MLTSPSLLEEVSDTTMGDVEQGKQPRGDGQEVRVPGGGRRPRPLLPPASPGPTRRLQASALSHLCAPTAG